MERKDIVLKNLAQEIKFGKHELLRVNKIDQEIYGDKIEKLDFKNIEMISEKLMDIVKDETAKNLLGKAYGTILLKGNCKIQLLQDILAKAFRTGNKVIIASELNSSHSYQHIQKAWQSVMASQGYDTNHIQFTTALNTDQLQVELCLQLEGLTNSNIEIELSNFTKGHCI